MLATLSACAGGGSGPAVGEAAHVECAPYARSATGLQLYGDAADWWDQAASRYDREARPSPGDVLVFRRSGRLPHGHVSVVVGQAGPRQILVTQANWVHGRITRREPVEDVSPGNDWTAVRVWWAPAGVLGSTVYPTYGFIAPRPPAGTGLVAAR